MREVYHSDLDTVGRSPPVLEGSLAAASPNSITLRAFAVAGHTVIPAQAGIQRFYSKCL
jgi:hypothetical protein